MLFIKVLCDITRVLKCTQVVKWSKVKWPRWWGQVFKGNHLSKWKHWTIACHMDALLTCYNWHCMGCGTGTGLKGSRAGSHKLGTLRGRAEVWGQDGLCWPIGYHILWVQGSWACALSRGDSVSEDVSQVWFTDWGTSMVPPTASLYTWATWNMVWYRGVSK